MHLCGIDSPSPAAISKFLELGVKYYLTCFKWIHYVYWITCTAPTFFSIHNPIDTIFFTRAHQPYTLLLSYWGTNLFLVTNIIGGVYSLWISTGKPSAFTSDATLNVTFTGECKNAPIKSFHSFPLPYHFANICIHQWIPVVNCLDKCWSLVGRKAVCRRDSVDSVQTNVC